LSNSKFTHFVEITKRLRKECPWDKEQTHASIRHSLIEEAYEVVEAIDNNNLEELKKEFGSETSIKMSNRITVIGGSIVAVDLATKKAEDLGINSYPVDDNDAAYHTSQMDGAVPRLANVLNTLAIQNPHTPLFANSNASEMTDGKEVKTELSVHIAKTAEQQSMMSAALEKQMIDQVVEMGNPNGTIINHLQRDLEDQNPTVKRGTLKKKLINAGIGAGIGAGVALGTYLILRALKK